MKKKAVRAPRYTFVATVHMRNGAKVVSRSGSFGREDQPEPWMIQNKDDGSVDLSFMARDGVDADHTVHRLMQREARGPKPAPNRAGPRIKPTDYNLVKLTSNYTGDYDIAHGTNPTLKKPKVKPPEQFELFGGQAA